MKFRRYNWSRLCLGVTLTALGCGNPRAGAANTAETGGADAGADAYGARDAAELFAETELPTFELSMPPERWEHLQKQMGD